MLEYYIKENHDTEFKRISNPLSGCWIYAKNANLEDIQKISELTKLDIADIRDALDKYELPRIESFDDNLILFLREAANYEQGLYTQTLTLIFSKDYIICISPYTSDTIERLIGSNTQITLRQKGKLILNILMRITQEFSVSVKRVKHSISGSEEPTQEINSNSILILTKNEEILNQHLTAIVPMRNLLEMIANGRYIHFAEEELELLEDLLIAMHQSEDICKVNIKSIRSLRDSYHIIFTNDVNRTIKLLTAVTIIFTIPNVIASIYGMNVALPFSEHPHAFSMIIGFTILSIFIALLLFKKNRWL